MQKTRLTYRFFKDFEDQKSGGICRYTNGYKNWWKKLFFAEFCLTKLIVFMKTRIVEKFIVIFSLVFEVQRL